MDTTLIKRDIKNFMSNNTFDMDLISKIAKAFGPGFYNKNSSEILFSKLVIDNESQHQIECLLKKVEPNLHNIFIDFQQLNDDFGHNDTINKIVLVYLIIKNKAYTTFSNPTDVLAAKRVSATKLLKNEYETDKELTAFTILDSEDFYETE